MQQSQWETLSGGTQVLLSAAHRFGEDALLLAEFCGVKPQESACDFGTGCGVIPLYWHDRGHRGPCTAVELQPEAVAQLQEALLRGGITHIAPVCADVRTFALPRPCDVVACNPPYFTAGRRSPSAARALARHADTCTLNDVCNAAARALRRGGRLCVCQRPGQLTDVFCAMRAAHIEPKRLQLVAARPDTAPFLALVEGRLFGAKGLVCPPVHFTQHGNFIGGAAGKEGRP